MFSLYILQLNVLQYINELLDKIYSSSKLLQGVITALKDLGAQAWPKELKQRLRILYSECCIVTSKAYFCNRLIIDPNNTGIYL